MASLRMLKKDVDYLIEEILSDCLLTMYLHPDRKEKAAEIMEQAVALRNIMFDKINKPVDCSDRKAVRKHFNQIRKDMFGTVDALFKELSVLNK